MAITISPFYSPSFSVGRGGDNFPDDVMLIQYMLFKLLINSTPHFEPRALSSPFSNVLPGELGADNQAEEDPSARALFPINGRYRRELDGWISSFQASCNQLGLGRLVVDGRVDASAVGWGPRVRGRQRWTTIHALNTVMEARCHLDYMQLPDIADLNMPTALRVSLKQFSVPSWGC